MDILARQCSVDGCDRPARRRGLCSRHGIQQKSGAPLARLPKWADGTEPIAERMEWRTARTETCWNWTGAKHSGGYGQIRFGGKALYAHRVAWELANGPIPARMVIDHTCHNRMCVRPSHMHAVTSKQNGENLELSKANRSGVRGVHWDKRRNKWCARVTHNGVGFAAGSYDSLPEAESAVINLRNQLHTNNLSDRGTGYVPELVG